jgi:AraC-like DNA-binding protein
LFLTLDDIFLTVDDMQDLVRATTLAGVGEFITQMGADLNRWFRDVGIDPDLIGDQSNFVPYAAVAAVVARGARDLRMPDFGLRLSKVQDLSIMGPLAVLARNSPRVDTALHSFITYLYSYSPAISNELRTGPSTSSFEFDIQIRNVASPDQMVERAVGVILGMFQLLVGPDFCPTEVTFRHAPISPVPIYEQFFGSPVRFGCSANAVTFPTSLLVLRREGIDEVARSMVLRMLEDTYRENLDDRIRELVRRLLPARRADLTDVAHTLAVHPRTLQRNLDNRGTSFGQIVEEVRKALALELLAIPEMPLALVAHQLGYSEQSVLSRSCQRWFGTSPRRLRGRLTSTIEVVPTD